MKNSSETELAGKIVIVTGASSGLGVELARALAAAGAVPVVAARRAERLAEVIAALPRADAITCDVTREDDRERLVAQVLERHGRIDGLVNNAGMGATAPALKTPATTFSRVVDLNLVAPYALSCLVAEHMRNGGNGGGKAVVQNPPGLGVRPPREGPHAGGVAAQASPVW